VLGIPLDGRAERARLGLFAAHPRHPGGVARDEVLERQDFAHVAAGAARLGAVEEAVRALPLDEARELARIREDHANPVAIAALQPLEQLVGLLV
jgi:hypothetical protein